MINTAVYILFYLYLSQTDRDVTVNTEQIDFGNAL